MKEYGPQFTGSLDISQKHSGKKKTKHRYEKIKIYNYDIATVENF
jgi:hypothetical protein